MGKSVFVAVRVTPEIAKSVDEVAVQRGISRSALVRDLLANCHSLYSLLESERRGQQSDRIALDGNLSQWVLDNMPNGTTTEMLDFLGRVMQRAAEMKRIQEVENEG
jgi:nitric oxide reductase activation protein